MKIDFTNNRIIGKVVINGLYTNESFEYEHHRPVMSVALDPHFTKTNNRAFAIGGRAGQLIINSKGKIEWYPENTLTEI